MGILVRVSQVTHFVGMFKDTLPLQSVLLPKQNDPKPRDDHYNEQLSDTATFLLSYVNFGVHFFGPGEYVGTDVHWATPNERLTMVKLLAEASALVASANHKNHVSLDLGGFNEKFDVVDYFFVYSGAPEEATEGV